MKRSIYWRLLASAGVLAAGLWSGTGLAMAGCDSQYCAYNVSSCTRTNNSAQILCCMSQNSGGPMCYSCWRDWFWCPDQTLELGPPYMCSATGTHCQ